MRRLTLDPSLLRVQSFAVSVMQPLEPATGESYPECPTATGCTCVSACLSIVGGCAGGAAAAA